MIPVLNMGIVWILSICPIRASYGLEDVRKALYCFEHSKLYENMIDVKNKYGIVNIKERFLIGGLSSIISLNKQSNKSI